VSDPGQSTGSELPLHVLVESFEAATLPAGRFHHREHLRVALCYLSRESETDATRRMRAGLKRLLAQHRIDGYHETLTVFWMKLLAARLAATDSARPLNDRIEDVIRWCRDEQPVARYYTPEALASSHAKHTWTPPDRKPIDF
jgi:hypothetical protein